METEMGWQWWGGGGGQGRVIEGRKQKERKKERFRFKSVPSKKMLGLPGGGPESEPFDMAL